MTDQREELAKELEQRVQHEDDTGVWFVCLRVSELPLVASALRTPTADREAALEEAAKVLDHLRASICGVGEWDNAQRIAFEEAALQVRALKTPPVSSVEGDDHG